VDFLNIPAHIPGDIQQARQVVKNPRPIMMIGNDGKPTPESIKAMQKWLKADNLVNTPPTYWAIAFPLWMVAIITLIAPSTLLFYPFVRSHWRRRYGRCTGCGYSLTANISGVCPECGTAYLPSLPACVTGFIPVQSPVQSWLDDRGTCGAWRLREMSLTDAIAVFTLSC